jgi:hypothetical protein
MLGMESDPLHFKYRILSISFEMERIQFTAQIFLKRSNGGKLPRKKLVNGGKENVEVNAL